LRNPIYGGRVRHKAETFPGEHPAIVTQELWSRVQARMKQNARMGGPAGRHKYGAVLRGLLHCGPCNRRMGHTTAVKSQSRIYRYYTCYNAQKKGWESCPCKALPAMEIENFVLEQVKKAGKDPVVLAMTLSKCRERDGRRRAAAEAELNVLERELKGLHSDLTRASLESSEPANPDSVVGARLADLHEKVQKASERAEALRREIAELVGKEIGKAEVDGALQEFGPVWDALTPREQTALLHLLVQRVEYDAEKGSVSIRFHPLGLRTIKGTEKAA